MPVSPTLHEPDNCNAGHASLLERVPDTVLRLDHELRCLYANRAAERALKRPRAELLGRTLAQLSLLNADAGRQIEKRCREAAAERREVCFTVHDGVPPGVTHYLVSVIPEDGADPGAPASIACVLQDISAQVAAERALEQSAAQHREALARERRQREQAEALAKEAQAATRMKDEFLATLSHELRTPLNAILGWTQTLQANDVRSPTIARALAQIEQSARAQARLIEDLLNVSDIVAGRMRLDIQPMRLLRAMGAVMEAMHPAIEVKSLQVETSFDPAADVIYGDPIRIQQIFWNLLSNAVKFTPRGGTIRIALSKEEGVALISIADSGEGIAPDFLPYVFDRFRQADASSRKRHGGLGIGLAIARYLVEMHGGSVRAHSAGTGRGAVFEVRLPLPAWNGAETPPERRLPEGRAGESARRRRQRLPGVRVLAVDDDHNSRDMLQEALQRSGALVQVAGTAREALEKLRSFRPHVLVSDIGMPNEDGYDLLRRVRALPLEQGGNTPAIALTGFAREEDRAMTWQAGYQAVIPKPVNLEELLSTLAALARARTPQK